LVPNNFLLSKNKIYICDWVNGGEHSMVYDLMVQNVYFADSPTWKNFEKIDFLQSNKKYFFGWTKSYLVLFQKHHAVFHTNESFKLSLLVALFEMSLKNYVRHQNKGACDDGKEMLLILERIFTNILASA
jgi:hypothetical protein